MILNKNTEPAEREFCQVYICLSKFVEKLSAQKWEIIDKYDTESNKTETFSLQALVSNSQNFWLSI